MARPTPAIKVYVTRDGRVRVEVNTTLAPLDALAIANEALVIIRRNVLIVEARDRNVTEETMENIIRIMGMQKKPEEN